MAAALAPWSVRNHRADGGFSPLPHNGGIVLHQIYNAQNPQSAIWIPPFVNYSNPSEIWRGYAAEAQRIAGRPLSPTEVDRYWKDQALGFMWQHPGTVVEDVLRKSLVFLAATEVPNNRSSMEERLFSPVLSALPVSMAWLLAMGLAGTAWFAIQDRRWLVVAAPIAIAWLTMAVFWAEDRFRFHAAPALALMSGVWLDGLIGGVRRGWQAPAAGLLAAAIAAASLSGGARLPRSAGQCAHRRGVGVSRRRARPVPGCGARVSARRRSAPALLSRPLQPGQGVPGARTPRAGGGGGEGRRESRLLR